MSDLPPDLVRPAAPEGPGWRERLAATAESLDLTPRRLVLGVVALVAAALLAWRALAPPAPPAEMELPFADPAAPAGAETSAGGGGGSGDPGASGEPAGPGAGGAGPGSGSAVAGGGAGAGGPAGSGPGGSGSGGSGSGGAGTQPSEVVVHVAGGVRAPGVQRLPAGARVVDAVDAAGGAVPEADLGRINLAVPVEDGQQVYVPRVGEVPPAPASGAAGGAGPAGSTAGSVGGSGPAGAEGATVNVNTASVDELDTLPGVGPATAEAIIAYRETNGPFTSVDQLLDVRGIGEAKLEQMRDRVAV